MAARRIDHYIHKQKEGLAPGTLLYPGAGEPETTVITTHRFAQGFYQAEAGFSAAQEGVTRFVQVCGLQDLQSIIEVAKSFSISNLSLEDAFSTNQRLKVDEYDTYIAVTMRLVGEDEQQITLFLGDGWVLSIAERQSTVFDPLISRLATPSSKLQSGGASLVFHSLIDLIVDQYLLEADALELATEELEALAITSAQQVSASSIHSHRAQVMRLRRMTGPLREVVSLLIRSENPLIGDSTTFLLRDIQDHAMWLAEELEMLRETTSSIMEVYLSSLDIRMNSIMKVLTIISTIFIPLTFVTGLYGMNFIHIPFSSLWWGFYAILAGCAIVVLILTLYFRKKQWW
jgi:magnesium transporter